MSEIQIIDFLKEIQKNQNSLFKCFIDVSEQNAKIIEQLEELLRVLK